jgi:hypothetical protein
MSTMMIEVAARPYSLPICLTRGMKIFDKTEDSHFSPLKEIFSGRMIQQRW